MKLVIHDLKPEAWARIAGNYPDARVVSEDRPIRPCVGCFGCWCVTPGECVVKDGFHDMGEQIHRAEEVVVISRYTYGGFSGFVKNVFDRSLAYVLPQFEIVKGESHHKKRYEEDKPFTFIFYGQELTEAEKRSAWRYVKAVCTNIRGHVKNVLFREEMVPAAAGSEESRPVCPEVPTSAAPGKPLTTGKTAFLIGSMRGIEGNSGKLAGKLTGSLKEAPEIIELKRYLQDLPGLVKELDDVETLVLCLPLYVDGLPAQVIRFMECMEREYQGGPKKIYLLANMGLYESRQLVNLFSAVKQWSAKMGFSYGGGLGVSAGEMIGVLLGVLPYRFWVTKDVARGTEQLAAAICSGQKIQDIYVEPYAFPRSLYNAIANSGWSRNAKAAGLRPRDLYRQL